MSFGALGGLGKGLVVIRGGVLEGVSRSFRGLGVRGGRKKSLKGVGSFDFLGGWGRGWGDGGRG